MVTSLAAAGWLLVAPNGVASIRLVGVSLAWWAVLAALGLGMVALVFGLRGETATDRA